MKTFRLNIAVLSALVLLLSVLALCLLSLLTESPITQDTHAALQYTATPLPTATPPAPPCGGAISYGSSRSGWINYPQTTCSYSFSGTSGNVVTIAMNKQSAGLDPYLELQAPNGVIVTYNDDGGGNYNSLISGFLLDQTGTYAIRAHSWNYQSTGNFTICIAKKGINNMSYGCSIYDDLPNALPHRRNYTFQGGAGDRITIIMNKQSNNLDPYLRLVAPNGAVVAVDDDSGGNYNSRISSFQLNQSGTHTIVAGSYQDQTYGPYVLSLLR